MDGGINFTRTNVSKIPIPVRDGERSQSVIALVDLILAAKCADPAADTTAWERGG
ncbi:MAG: hypothetical protein GW893_10675 [Armatimonadetes bacterium]|nr:hypothetical protein [Armatimonadota bacterium]